jgi:hypothetical protein
MTTNSVLRKYPDHVQLIGMIAIESSNLEIALAGLFARMLMLPVRTGRAIYLTPQAAHARLDILRNAGKATFDRSTKSEVLTEQYKNAFSRLKKILQRASDAINSRHRLVHIRGTTTTMIRR